MNINICKFVTTKKYDNSLNIINFVYEKEANFKKEYIIPSTYTLALVTEGSGALHTNDGVFNFTKGDLFVTLPANAYYIENIENLKYIYISFIGMRAQVLFDRLKISRTMPIFHEFDFLIETWEENFSISNELNSDLFCEALLLHTFGFMSRDNKEATHTEKVNNLLLAKQYVDANYTDSNLNLKTVSQKFSYNPKYFSAAFKKMVRINFSEYLKLKRLNYSITLIEGGITNINDLAELCGYKEPLYFSKCFKAKYGASPKKWLLGKTK